MQFFIPKKITTKSLIKPILKIVVVSDVCKRAMHYPIILWMQQLYVSAISKLLENMRNACHVYSHLRHNKSNATKSNNEIYLVSMKCEKQTQIEIRQINIQVALNLKLFVTINYINFNYKFHSKSIHKLICINFYRPNNCKRTYLSWTN